MPAIPSSGNGPRTTCAGQGDRQPAIIHHDSGATTMGRTVDDDRQHNFAADDGLVQPDLFDVGDRTMTPSQGRMKRPCTPFAPGTGPEGETCGTCLHKAYQGGTAGHYIKCAKMRAAWTRGAATDIRARWPACGAWEQGPTAVRTPRKEGKALMARILNLAAKGDHDEPQDTLGKSVDDRTAGRDS